MNKTRAGVFRSVVTEQTRDRVKGFLILLVLASPAQATPPEGATIASVAMAQVGVTRRYDPSYVKLAYPGGDVPLDRGVCSDVVIRSFRKIGIDLQALVHEDMKSSFRVYPQRWGLRRPDRNIDHRRVPNLMRFFERKGKARRNGSSFEPGDVVAWKLPNGLYHIGIVSSVRNRDRTEYLVVHNIGEGAKNEDVLRAFQIIGHYRW